MNQPLPTKDTIWIGTVNEVAERSAEGRPIAADIESLDVAIESAIFALKGSKNTHRFILGVDTGPRPGLAWFTDGVLIDTKQTESALAALRHKDRTAISQMDIPQKEALLALLEMDRRNYWKFCQVRFLLVTKGPYY